MVEIEKINAFTNRLYSWFSENMRSFPWRTRKEIYSTLIAEVLLQKTNAQKVIPVYNKIIDQFPSPFYLSSASPLYLQIIIKPLGLVYKAELLVKIAKQISTVNENEIDLDYLLKIKGIGNYIARSVMIHCKEQHLSLLDPNFIRIFDRVFELSSPLKRPRTDKKLWEASLSIVPKENPSKFTYAMLDFGALVCTLRKPKCEICPMFPDICKGF